MLPIFLDEHDAGDIIRRPPRSLQQLSPRLALQRLVPNSSAQSHKIINNYSNFSSKKQKDLTFCDRFPEQSARRRCTDYKPLKLQLEHQNYAERYYLGRGNWEGAS